jgi:hypothetical protein
MTFCPEYPLASLSENISDNDLTNLWERIRLILNSGLKQNL